MAGDWEPMEEGDDQRVALWMMYQIYEVTWLRGPHQGKLEVINPGSPMPALLFLGNGLNSASSPDRSHDRVLGRRHTV
jgi:hypothetical protein